MLLLKLELNSKEVVITEPSQTQTSSKSRPA